MKKIKDEFSDIDDLKGRIKKIRELLRLPRSYFEKKYKLSEVTLKAWESGSVANINQKSIDKVLRIFRNEGIIISEEWLTTGNGQPPFLSRTNDFHTSHLSYNKKIKMDAQLSEEISAIKEIEILLSLFNDAVHMYILDESMSPIYPIDSVVIGRKLFGEKIIDAVGKDCILKIAGNESLIFRRLSRFHENSFALHILNPVDGIMDPVIIEPKIEFAAPVIWIRRK